MRSVFFDLETGGADPSRHPITQIAAVAVDEHLNELESFECKVRFDESAADPKALELNHYDPEVWAEKGLAPRMAADRFARFLKKYDDVLMVSQAGKPYRVAQLIGYNAATFDGPFLQRTYKELGVFLPASFRVMCLLQRVLWGFHEDPRKKPPADFKLGTVCKYFEIPLEGAHDALADVRATVNLSRVLVGKPVAGSPLPLSVLDEPMGEVPELQEMPF